MTTKTFKTVLFAALIAAMILPFSGMNPVEAQVMDKKLLVSQYNEIFGDDKISDEKKAKVVESMINGETVELVQPKDQDKVAKEVVKILKQIEKSNDKSEKEQLKAQIKNKGEKMLNVGLVLADDYKANPEHWDAELDRTANSAERTETKKAKDPKVKSVIYNEDSSNLKFVSGEPFKSSIYQKFWCYSGFIVCTSTTVNLDMDYGEMWSPNYTLGSEAWYGFIAPYHKMKNISGSTQNSVDVESWVSIKRNTTWVDSCYDDNTFNFTPAKTHYWTVCTSDESNGGNVIYHTLFIN